MKLTQLLVFNILWGTSPNEEHGPCTLMITTLPPCQQQVTSGHPGQAEFNVLYILPPVNGFFNPSVTVLASGIAKSGVMSENFSSSNPFRRKGPVSSAPVSNEAPHPQQHSVEKPLPPIDTSDLDLGQNVKAHSKPVKHVRVQSPPPSSPEGDSIYRKPPTLISRGEGDLPAGDDPFDEISSSDTSDTSEAVDDVPPPPPAKNSGTPLNPFQKTLATLERTEGELHTTSSLNTQGVTGAGKTSLDVDAFKRLLLTGSATVAPSSAPIPALAHFGHLGLTDGNSTDASSISRQSVFETVQENHPESPRTSHEISDPDEERRRLAPDASGPQDRKKPPPPNSRHGKLIKVELKDDTSMPPIDPVLALASRSQTSLNSPGSAQSHRSPTDVNKPLPPAPTRASHESDRESVFDKEAAGKVPEPPSPPLSSTKKAPPVPPLTRRWSQLSNSEPKLVRSSTGNLTPSIEEGSSMPLSQDLPGTPKAPPPPPSRRPASIRNSSCQITPAVASPPAMEENERSLMASPAPLPPPARKSSQRTTTKSSSNRPPSVHSIDTSSPPATTKRHSAHPPPPPPARQRASSRNSLEAPSARQSGEYLRRSTESARISQSQTPLSEEDESVGSRPSHDILADLSALQREVDALRDQYKNKNEEGAGSG